MKEYFQIFTSKPLNEILTIALLAASFVAFSCAYLFLSPKFTPIAVKDRISNLAPSVKKCNAFEGKWIADGSYPLYNASLCPFAETGFNCLANGRRDSEFTKLRWKPNECDLPRFDARTILKKLAGKRIVFVGDSLGRTQWESLICMLMSSVDDKRSVYEINGSQITKTIGFLGVHFSTFNVRIDFYRSVFLVKTSGAPKRAPKRVKSAVVLDKIDDVSSEWADSDVLVFNTGHWWNANKLFQSGCYFQQRGSLKLGMSVNAAFRAALGTWASWVERHVDTNRTRVFFRTFEGSHWSGGSRMTCKVSRRPMRGKGRGKSVISEGIIWKMKRMKVPVRVLHATPMGASRSDGHVGKWGDDPAKPDCSHWCLPGVPDAWNEVLLGYLFSGNVTIY